MYEASYKIWYDRFTQEWVLLSKWNRCPAWGVVYRGPAEGLLKSLDNLAWAINNRL